MLKKNIKRIVLTGGPCAGKTTIFNAIYEYLTKKDYYDIYFIKQLKIASFFFETLENPTSKNAVLTLLLN